MIKREVSLKKVRSTYASENFQGITMLDLVDENPIPTNGVYFDHFNSTATFKVDVKVQETMNRLNLAN